MNRIDSHEKICAERYRRIDEKLDALTKGQEGLAKGAWGLLIAICAWLALQVYDGLKDHDPPHPFQAQAAEVSALHP